MNTTTCNTKVQIQRFTVQQAFLTTISPSENQQRHVVTKLPQQTHTRFSYCVHGCCQSIAPSLIDCKRETTVRQLIKEFRSTELDYSYSLHMRVDKV